MWLDNRLWRVKMAEGVMRHFPRKWSFCICFTQYMFFSQARVSNSQIEWKHSYRYTACTYTFPLFVTGYVSDSLRFKLNLTRCSPKISPWLDLFFFFPRHPCCPKTSPIYPWNHNLGNPGYMPANILLVYSYTLWQCRAATEIINRQKLGIATRKCESKKEKIE